MSGKRSLVMLVAILLLVGSVIPVFTSVTAQPPDPKTVYGRVLANATGVRAYDPNPGQNGIVSIYIQNGTNNGTDVDVGKYFPPPLDFDGYSNAIHDSVAWKPGDPGVVIVDVENGTGPNRAGYVAYVSDILDKPTNPQQFPDTELRKIPVPTLDINGMNFLNFSWTPLPDPSGLIAGYTIYRSSDNATWGLVSGNKDAPVTVAFFNDTSVSPNSNYYYAIKVCFVGYANNNPANVNNYETIFYGEGSSIMTTLASALGVDFIVIQENSLPFGPEVITITIDVGKSTQQVFAVGYNGTPPGTFVGAQEVNWTRDQPSLGYCNPVKSTQTVFTAYYEGGSVEVKGRNDTLGLEDTFTVIINPPSIDYIRLTDLPNGTEIPDGPILWWVGDPLDIYASAYNLTGAVETYIRVVDVTWTDTPDRGDFLPAVPSNYTVFTGTSGGITTIKGENTSMTPTVSDTFQLNLQVPPTIDYIYITSDEFGVNPLVLVDLSIGEQVTVYASGYNNSLGWIKLMDVDWTLTPLGPVGYIDNLTGTKTTFFANLTLTGGSLSLIATSGTMTNTTIMNVLQPTVDYIYLTKTPGGVRYNLATQTLNIGAFMDIHASGYNNTGPTYLGRYVVDWTDSAGLGTFLPTTGENTTFTAGGTTGSTTIKGEYTVSIFDTFLLNIVELDLDNINLTDLANGEKITSWDLDVGETLTIYASGYNTSTSPHTYWGPVEVDWTDSAGLGEFSVDTGTSTIFTAGMAGGTTTIKGRNDALDLEDTFLLTINPPTVDYILIVDTSGTGATEIDDQTVDVGVTITGYAASFNITALYIGEVQVTWSVTNENDATASTEPLLDSITSDFYSGNHEGTATWTAEFTGGITDTVEFTINPPTVDYIQIRTAADGLGEVVTTAQFNVDGTDTDQYYCAAYNYSVGFIGDMAADWTVTGGIGTVVPSTGQFTVFTATTAGSGTITAEYNTITNSTGTITVYTQPTAPTGLQVQQVAAGGALNLVWTANPEAYVDGYDIWRSPTGASGSFVKIADSVTGTSYQDTGLTNGDTRYYYIVAIGVFPAPNASEPSTTVSQVVDADTDGDLTFNLQDDDDDNDGLLDTEEDKNGDGRIEGDTNNDRIWDDDEDWKETDPLNEDTDGDGHNDKDDYYPLDPDKWKKEEEFPIMLVILPIIIIIIIVLIVLMLLMKKRKPEEIPAVPEEERELPPPPGAIAEEEEMPPEEEELPSPEEEALPEGEEGLPEEEEPLEEEEETPPGEEAPPSEKETPP